MIEWVTMEESTFMAPPERFEAGSQPVAQIAAWSRALRYMSTLGMDRIEAHEHADPYDARWHFFDRQHQGAGSKTDVDRIGVVAFAVEGVHPHDVSQFPWTPSTLRCASDTTARSRCAFFQVARPVPPSRRPAVEEIERLVDGLAQVRSFFGQ